MRMWFFFFTLLGIRVNELSNLTLSLANIDVAFLTFTPKKQTNSLLLVTWFLWDSLDATDANNRKHLFLDLLTKKNEWMRSFDSNQCIILIKKTYYQIENQGWSLWQEIFNHRNEWIFCGTIKSFSKLHCDNYVLQWWVEFDDELSWFFTKRFRAFFLICRK